MKVAYTSRAKRRVIAVGKWWRTYRPAAPDLFDQELIHAVSVLMEQPHLGVVYTRLRGALIRRILLPQTEQYLYYAVDPVASLVIIHTIWGARRGRSPAL